MLRKSNFIARTVSAVNAFSDEVAISFFEKRPVRQRKVVIAKGSGERQRVYS